MSQAQTDIAGASDEADSDEQSQGTSTAPGQSRRADPGADSPGAGLRAGAQARRWGQVVLWSLVLLLVFAAAAAAIVHFSRRYRVYLLHERDQPTEDADVWSMHRPPPGPTAEPPIEPNNGGGGGADEE